ncbi:unnamed protein product [Absidia cylindrospora]
MKNWQKSLIFALLINFSHAHSLNIPSLGVPEFPARDGPQQLAAAATPQSKRRQKVMLEPGHSPLDWARLKSSGQDLRVGEQNLILFFAYL